MDKKIAAIGVDASKFFIPYLKEKIVKLLDKNVNPS